MDGSAQQLAELRAVQQQMAALYNAGEMEAYFALIHAMLAEIYGWFTEGFNTHDLRAARALLAVLAPVASLERP
jgi:hypothetical protein